MTTTTSYEILIRGRASARVLRPLLDDFTVDHEVAGATRLCGSVRDAAHLHGIVAHLTSIGADLISIAPVPHRADPPAATPMSNHPASNATASNATTTNETSSS